MMKALSLLLLGALLISVYPTPAVSQPPKPQPIGHDRPPVPISLVKPNYPFELRKEGVSGVVKVRITISEAGRVVDAEIIESPHEAFSKAALDAVKKWKFEPGLANGVPVATRATYPIHFDIEQAPEKKPQP